MKIESQPIPIPHQEQRTVALLMMKPPMELKYSQYNYLDQKTFTREERGLYGSRLSLENVRNPIYEPSPADNLARLLVREFDYDANGVTHHASNVQYDGNGNIISLDYDTFSIT